MYVSMSSAFTVAAADFGDAWQMQGRIPRSGRNCHPAPPAFGCLPSYVRTPHSFHPFPSFHAFFQLVTFTYHSLDARVFAKVAMGQSRVARQAIASSSRLMKVVPWFVLFGQQKFGFRQQ
jgi:hypothetical protein